MAKGNIEITTAIPCVMMCTYCPQALLMKNYDKSNDKFMSLSTFKSCLDKIPTDISVSFAGYSESFLNADCHHMIRYAYDRGYEVNLYTTLVGFKEEYLDVLYPVNFNTVVLHLPDVEGHMKAKVDDNYIYNCRQFNNQIGYNSAICYGTVYPRLREIFPQCVDHPYKDTHSRAGNIDTDKISYETTDRLSGKIDCGVKVRHGLDVLRFSVLLPNGEVTLCCMDYGKQHVIGNLLTDEYEDLYTSEAYKLVEQGLADDTIDILCRECKEAINV